MNLIFLQEFNKKPNRKHNNIPNKKRRETEFKFEAKQFSKKIQIAVNKIGSYSIHCLKLTMECLEIGIKMVWMPSIGKMFIYFPSLIYICVEF